VRTQFKFCAKSCVTTTNKPNFFVRFFPKPNHKIYIIRKNDLKKKSLYTAIFKSVFFLVLTFYVQDAAIIEVGSSFTIRRLSNQFACYVSLEYFSCGWRLFYGVHIDRIECVQRKYVRCVV
jgi:hypothetical protein